MTKAFSQAVRYNAVTRSSTIVCFTGAEDLGNVFQFKRDFNEEYCGARNPAVARSLNPTSNVRVWLAEQRTIMVNGPLDSGPTDYLSKVDPVMRRLIEIGPFPEPKYAVRRSIACPRDRLSTAPRRGCSASFNDLFALSGRRFPRPDDLLAMNMSWSESRILAAEIFGASRSGPKTLDGLYRQTV